MTSNQRISILAQRWPAACHTQGWDPKDRAKRIEVISHAVGRHVSSLNDLDNADDIDRVFAHLGMLADSLAATVEVVHPETGKIRRLRWQIGQLSNQLGRIYALNIMRDRFGRSQVEDLTLEQLVQFRNTLASRASAHRRRAQAAAPAPAMATANCDPF